MKKYRLTDTSEQTITYECIVEANSEEEAIEKADNWKEIDKVSRIAKMMDATDGVKRDLERSLLEIKEEN